MRIALLSYECPPAEHRNLSYPNKKKYCTKHGYDFISNEKSLAPEYHPAWSKIPYLQKYLPEYDWVVWTDADTYVINSEIKLESFMENSKDMVIQCDYEQKNIWADPYIGINSGVIFVKNSLASYGILENWWNTRSLPTCKSPNNDQWDQLGLKIVIGSRGEKYEREVKTILDHKTGFNVVPEFVNKYTFIMHNRRGHRDFERKRRLIY